MTPLHSSPLSPALLAANPLPERSEKLQLYARLVGSWEIDVVMHNRDGRDGRLRGSINAGWVLEGRAIQDVFSVPGLFYGTSVRFYDPKIDAWQVFRIDTLKSVFFHMIGRQQGSEIVNDGKETPELARAYGSPEKPAATVRWIVSGITTDAFQWRSERSAGDGPWQLQREYFARRITG
jgi:hypothetical protein